MGYSGGGGGIAKAAAAPSARTGGKAPTGGAAATAAETAGKLTRGAGGIGDLTLKQLGRKAQGAAAGGALLGAGGLAAWTAGELTAGFFTDRERDLAERVSRLGEQGSTAVAAAFQAEADAGHAWADSMVQVARPAYSPG